METDNPPAGQSFPAEVAAVRQALIAGYGTAAGADATARAVRAAARRRGRGVHSPRLLYRAGRAATRWYRSRSLELPEVPPGSAAWIDPALPGLLASLRRVPRIALLLCHGHGWTSQQVSDMLGITPEAVDRLGDQGMAKLGDGLTAASGGPARPVADQVAAYAELLDRAAPSLAQLAVGSAASGRFEAWPARRVLLALGVVMVLAIGAGMVARTLLASDSVDTTAPPPEGSALAPVAVELLNPAAITPGSFPGGEHTATGPGAVVGFDGRLHMLAAAHGDGVATVGYATSGDGIVWSPGAAGSVLDLAAASWAPREFDQAMPRSLVVDAAGTWQLFFDMSWFDKDTNRLRSHIGRAVAADPAGEWSLDPLPVISPAVEFPWMSQQVGSPAVIPLPGGLLMLFVGTGDDGRGVVGIAQSPNGAAWDIRPGPVLAIDGHGVAAIDALPVADGIVAFFSGGDQMQRSLAASSNGLEWALHPGNPVLTGNASYLNGALFDTEFAFSGGQVLAFLENGAAPRDTEVAVARLEIDLEAVLRALMG